MADYRRELTLDPEKQYWYVDMGRLDRINGPGRYPFPTEAAALRFARNHKQIAAHRSIRVLYPDGRREPVELASLDAIPTSSDRILDIEQEQETHEHL